MDMVQIHILEGCDQQMNRRRIALHPLCNIRRPFPALQDFQESQLTEAIAVLVYYIAFEKATKSMLQ